MNRLETRQRGILLNLSEGGGAGKYTLYLSIHLGLYVLRFRANEVSSIPESNLSLEENCGTIWTQTSGAKEITATRKIKIVIQM